MLKTVKILCCVAFMVLALFLGYAATIYVTSIRTLSVPQLICGRAEKQIVLQQLHKEKTTHILTNNEYKHLIETGLDLNGYLYDVKKLSGRNGECNLYYRTIRIDPSLRGVYYARTFTHEAMRLKHYTEKEIFVCFQTFKFLYENENKYLRSAGVQYAIDNLERNVAEDYNITSQIMYYFLIEKGANNV